MAATNELTTFTKKSLRKLCENNKDAVLDIYERFERGDLTEQEVVAKLEELRDTGLYTVRDAENGGGR